MIHNVPSKRKKESDTSILFHFLLDLICYSHSFISRYYTECHIEASFDYLAGIIFNQAIRKEKNVLTIFKMCILCKNIIFISK